MKRKPVRRVKKARRHSAILGLLSDLALLFATLYAVISWPVRHGSHAAMRFLRRTLRRHPALRTHQAHHAVSIACGVALLTVSFVIGELYHHPLWSVCTETMKAAGVCPIWEAIAGLVRNTAPRV